MQFVQESFQTMGEHSSGMVLDWKIKTNVSYGNLLRGEATKKDLDNLISAVNIVEALLVVCKGKDADGTVARASCALIEICQRYAQGKRALKAPEIQAMRDLISFHDELIGLATVKQFEDAILWAKKEFRAGRAKKVREPI